MFKYNRILILLFILMFSIALYSCDDENVTLELTPTIESDKTNESNNPNNNSNSKEETPLPSEETKVDTNSTNITIYLDIDWENISDVWFNGIEMIYGPYDNESEFKVEIESESIITFDLDFKQHDYSWWHVQDTYQSWNCDSFVEVDMKPGDTYIVKDINWTYQWDNEEHKWYTCTINKVE